MRLRARHYASGQAIEVICAEGRILSIGPPTGEPATHQADWIAPAFFDLQINGCGGHSFNSPQLTVDQVRHVVAVCREHGIAALCPTLVTNSFESLRHGFATLREACVARELDRALPAFHLEGPYISSEDGPRGAHPREFVRKPNWDEFRKLQDAAGGRIRLVTLAPELDGALVFIEQLVASGVVVALGHTAATARDIAAAVAAGARLSTHLGNGSHALLPRHENYLWEQLAADALTASIISDGHHLPPAVIRCLVRAKTSNRIILTCDASSLAGLPPGRYREWDQEFEVQAGGKVTVAGTPYLAGSGVFLDTCVSNVLRHADVSLVEAVDMAGARPRALLGLPVRSLEAGTPADLVLFDWQPGGELHVKHTLTSD
ncbi:MAG: amidohydrolase family protein [Planctomycetes bacterium]|nr:amidohydrolase family protein [Planctomycetota bacterium]